MPILLIKEKSRLSTTEEHNYTALFFSDAKSFSSLLFVLGISLNEPYCNHSQAGVFGAEKGKNMEQELIPPRHLISMDLSDSHSRDPKAVIISISQQNGKNKKTHVSTFPDPDMTRKVWRL